MGASILLAPWPQVRIAEAEAAIAAVVRKEGIPGLSAAVVVRGEVRWTGAFGLADLENGLPVTPSTVFRLASLTKPITAVAVLQLMEKGRLDLDAPVQNVMSEFPAKPWPITPRQLLSHQSGLRNWTQEEFANTRRYPSIDDSVKVFADDPLVFAPGTRTLYSSFGYTLLGSLIERAGGSSYREYLKANVFLPAGMASAQVDDVQTLIPNRAHGYHRPNGGALANSVLSDVTNRVPAGGLCATAEDVARFANALMKGVLLKRETVEAMFTRQKLRDGNGSGYALGFVVGSDTKRREIYHLGGQPRVSAILYLLPDQGVAVVLLANLEGIGAPLTTLARGLAIAALR